MIADNVVKKIKLAGDQQLFSSLADDGEKNYLVVSKKNAEIIFQQKSFLTVKDFKKLGK